MRFLSFFIFIISIQLSAQDITCYHNDKGDTREKSIYPYDLNLYVKLLEKEGKVEGKAQYKFVYLRKEVDSVFFDAIKFSVSKITINNQEIKYRVDSAGITMVMPKNRKDTSDLVIEYSCYPERGMYFVNWNNPDKTTHKQIWTQGQGIDNRHWIPGIDDVANLLRMTTHITFNDQFPVVSNGNLVSTKSNLDKTKTWTYKMTYPHALYLTMIAAGDYKYKTQQSKGGIKLEQYYYPDKETAFGPTYQHSEVMMDWFESEIKVPYAWGKVYRNVPTQDFLFGAMENTTSTIFADYMHQDSRGSLERGYMHVNAHELAHQWFGDLITERSPPHHWLHESFATHYAKKFIHYLKGDAEFDWMRKGERDASFSAGKSNSLPVAHTYSGSGRHYPKGSFVLDMLRNELGNDNYRNSIAYYLRKFYHKNVETSDLLSSIYEATGRNVDWFFDQWIHRGGEPEIDVNYTMNANTVTVYTHQNHKRDETVKAFRLPMDLSIYFKNGERQSQMIELKNDKDTFKISFENNSAVKMALLDENMNFLRKISYKNSIDTTIAMNSFSALARLEAIERMKSKSWSEKQNLFLNVYHKESSPMVKQEIINQMSSSDTGDIALDILTHGLKDSHTQVRRSAIKAIFSHNVSLKEHLIERLSDSSYVNIENAVLKLIELYPSEKMTWLASIMNTSGINNNLTYLYHSQMYSDSTIKDKKNHLDKIKYLASQSGEYRSRIPAIEFLKDKNLIDIDIIQSLIQGSLYFHPGIRNTSIEYLKKIKKNHLANYDEAIKTFPFSEPNKTLTKLEEKLK